MIFGLLSFLVLAAPGLASVISPELITIRTLYESINPNPEELLEVIRREIPDTNATVASVTRRLEHYKAPMVVPYWFHETLSRMPTSSTLDQQVQALRQRAPRHSTLYRNVEELTWRAKHWMNYCVFKQRFFPEHEWCVHADIEIAGVHQPVFRMKTNALRMYLYEVELEAHEVARAALARERKRKRLQETSLATGGPVSPGLPFYEPRSVARPVRVKTEAHLSESELRILVVKELIQDFSMSADQIAHSISRATHQEICIQAVMRIRTEIRRPFLQPLWLHELLMAEPSVNPEDEGLLTRIRRTAPRSFDLEGIKDRVRVWNRMCIIPLKAGTENPPCVPHHADVNGQQVTVMRLRFPAILRFLHAIAEPGIII